MKSYEEIAASALERGREYETRQRAKRRNAGRVCLCSVAAAALVGAGAWQFGALDVRSDEFGDIGTAEPAISAAPPVSPDRGDVPDDSANAPSDPGIPEKPGGNSPSEPSSGGRNGPGVPANGANGAIGYPAVMVDGNGGGV